MEFRELCQKRYSVRNFLDKTIEREKLNLIVDNMRLAFSARNSQNWKFIVVDDKSLVLRLANCIPQSFAINSAAMILVLIPNKVELMGCGYDRHVVNGSIVTTILHYAAFDLGLGSVWIGKFDQMEAKNVLNIDDEWNILSINLLGYPEKPQEVVKKKQLVDIVSYNHFVK